MFVSAAQVCLGRKHQVIHRLRATAPGRKVQWLLTSVRAACAEAALSPEQRSRNDATIWDVANLPPNPFLLESTLVFGQ